MCAEVIIILFNETIYLISFTKWWRMQGSNLRPLACKASALPAELILQKNGDPYGTRTRDTAVKGRCLNRLTNGPCNYYVEKIMFPIVFLKSLSETNESYYIQIKHICKG